MKRNVLLVAVTALAIAGVVAYLAWPSSATAKPRCYVEQKLAACVPGASLPGHPANLMCHGPGSLPGLGGGVSVPFPPCRHIWQTLMRLRHQH
jgi:hypothetical protein